MADCLTCEEIEQRICDLSDELSSLSGCQGVKVNDSGISFDYTDVIRTKREVLKLFVDLHKTKCPKGAGELYEFVHVPCVKPATCVGTAACSTSRQRGLNHRRYRR
jgi:hypothetical protein